MTMMMAIVTLIMLAQIPEENTSKEILVETIQTSPRKGLATLINFSLTSSASTEPYFAG